MALKKKTWNINNVLLIKSLFRSRGGSAVYYSRKNMEYIVYFVRHFSQSIYRNIYLYINIDSKKDHIFFSFQAFQRQFILFIYKFIKYYTFIVSEFFSIYNNYFVLFVIDALFCSLSLNILNKLH